mgnify:CR=1 FL=1
MLREASAEHDKTASLTHVNVLGERLEDEARARRALHEMVLSLMDQLVVERRGRSDERVELRAQLANDQMERQNELLQLSSAVKAADKERAEIAATEARHRQQLLAKLEDEEKKRVALGILLVNEQKERLKLKTRLDEALEEDRKERAIVSNHLEILSRKLLALEHEALEVLQCPQSLLGLQQIRLIRSVAWTISARKKWCWCLAVSWTGTTRSIQSKHTILSPTSGKHS